MSQMTPFFDTDAIAVTKAYAAKYGLKTTADLKKVPHFTLGARPEFQGREQGALGIQKEYGVKNFTFKSLALGLQYQALDAGAVDAADVFTTDPQLAGGKYVVLSDPKHIFGFQNIALVINTKKLNELGGQQFMNMAVAIDKQQPGDVAKAFLSANHITS
jgi:osmoprotectant transport system substrate-binding protein